MARWFSNGLACATIEFLSKPIESIRYGVRFAIEDVKDFVTSSSSGDGTEIPDRDNSDEK